MSNPMGERKFKPTPKEAAHQPDGGVLWCPIPGCQWHQADSWVSRARMGKHLGAVHPDDVVYKKDELPEDLAEERKETV